MIWFIQNIVFSVSLIVIIHYLYLYFETTLTTPKVKDLIHCPKQKYHSLFETINNKLNAADAKFNKKSSDSSEEDHLGIVPRNSKKNNGYDGNNDNNECVSDNGSSSSSSSSSAMKNDLKSFLRTIGLKKQTTQTQPQSQQQIAPYEIY
jgi:hypothetical protein